MVTKFDTNPTPNDLGDEGETPLSQDLSNNPALIFTYPTAEIFLTLYRRLTPEKQPRLLTFSRNVLLMLKLGYTTNAIRRWVKRQSLNNEIAPFVVCPCCHTAVMYEGEAACPDCLSDPNADIETEEVDDFPICEGCHREPCQCRRVDVDYWVVDGDSDDQFFDRADSEYDGRWN